MTRVRAIVLSLVVGLAGGCSGPQAGSPPPSQTGPGATPSSVAATATTQPTNSPPTPGASVTSGAIPVGRVFTERLFGDPEGQFLGGFVLGTDGTARAVTLPFDQEGFTANWSPDGTKLLVSAFDGERLVNGVLELASGGWTPITAKGTATELDCTDWTPDATHVICAGGRGDDPSADGLYLVNLATNAQQRLTTSPYHHVVGTADECGGGENRAVSSPTGDRFAFVQQKCGTGEAPGRTEQGAIAVVSIDGSSVQVIVPLGKVRTHPGGEISWSPTDDLIAYGSQEGELWIVGADGTGAHAVPLPVRGFVYGPTWSPDGKWLLVSIAAAGGRSDLYVVAPDGSSATQITSSSEAEAYTDWGVAPKRPSSAGGPGNVDGLQG